VIVLHKSECPALCRLSYCRDQKHTCTCTAPTAEQLRELVEAAGNGVNAMRQHNCHYSADKLDAALRPFREAGEEGK